MGYIGKPQSSDPITVNTSNIDDGTIQAVDISSSFAAVISGSLGPNASLIRSLTAAGVSGSLGPNASLIRSLTATSVSGSLGPNASLIRSLTASTISGSFTSGFEHTGKISGSSTSTGSFGKVEVGSGKITTAGNITLDADGAQIRLEDGGTEFGRISRVSSDLVIKSISNNNDILFKGVDGSSTITALQLDMSEAGNAIFNNDVTIAGTLTAQEIHTEFTSASIMFESGSTKFGDTSDDTHEVTGSMTISGSFGVNDGNVHVVDKMIVGSGSGFDFSGDSNAFVVAAPGNNAGLQVVNQTGGQLMQFRQSNNNAGDLILYGAGTTKVRFSSNGSDESYINTGTNVGIGTTNPAGTLDILGDEQALTVRTSDSGRVGIVLQNSSTGNATNFTDGLLIKLDSDETGYVGLAADNPTKVLNLGANNTNVMTLSGSGNVGIGTNNPGRTLHIYNSSQAEIKLNTSGASNGGLIYYNDSETQFLIRAQESDGNITFQTGGTTERMRIDSSGNVGIGTNAPQSNVKLHVNGVFTAGDGVATSNTDRYNPTQPTIAHTVPSLASDGGTLKLFGVGGGSDQDNGAHLFFGGQFRSSGNPDVGFAKIVGAKESADSTETYPGYLAFYTRPHGGDHSEKMRITSAGNVAIGGTGGYQKLSVEGGHIYLSGGYSITWANGNATIAESSYALNFNTYNGSSVDTALTLSGNNIATFTGDIVRGNTDYTNRVYSGYGNGNQSWSVTVPIQDNASFLITAMFSHYGAGINSYGTTKMCWLACRDNSQSIHNIDEITSSNGGDWAISTSSSTVTVTHQAGNYVGGGHWWVKMEGSANL